MRVRILLAVLCLSVPALQAEPIRVLHVMSYHIGGTWNQQQFQAFREELKDLAIEYKVLELDARRKGRAAVADRAKQAIRDIHDWQPHLVYVNDDIAQLMVTRRFINHPIPFVYSGMNNRPEDYGFDRANNITGILEEKHFLPSVKLLKAIQPGIRRIAVITDADPAWARSIVHMQRGLETLPDLEIVDWSQPRNFADYRRKIREYQESADAIAFLGIFTFEDKDGKTVQFEEVRRWTAENSRLPDVSFWDSQVEAGTLCAVGISAMKQGRGAGRLARRILVDRVSPADLPATVITKGQPFISLARARDLGVPVPASLLLSSQVKTTYTWTK